MLLLFERLRCVREIAGGGDELGVVADLAGQRVGAEEVSPAPVAAVVPARVLRVQPLQRLGEPRVGDPHERVIVAAEQDVGEEGEFEPLPDRGQALEEVFPVRIAYEQVAAVAAVRGEVVDAVGEIARGAGHEFEARRVPSPKLAASAFRHTSSTLLSHSALDQNQGRTLVFGLPATLSLTSSPTEVHA